MAYRYLNLRIGAPARLAALRADAAKLAANPHRNMRLAANPTWRTVRYANFKSTNESISQGFNTDARGRKIPIWYCHTGPAFERETWADEIENSPIDHSGWYADPDGYDTYRGFVVALPHGRYLGGYYQSDNGERVYFANLFDCAREAARFADGQAEWYAEQERDYQMRWRAADALREKIESQLARLRECLALRNKPCFQRLRSEAADLVASIRDNRETLKTDFADIEV